MTMALVSCLVTPDFAFSFRKIIGLVYGIAVFYAIVEWGQWHRTILPTEALVVGLGCSAAILALLGTAWVIKLPILDQVISKLPEVLRGMPGAEAGFNPNQVSGALIMFVPVQLVLLWDTISRSRISGGRGLWLAAAAGLALALTCTVLLIAQSRASWAALLLGLLGMSAIAFKRLRILLGLTLIIAVGIAAILWPLGAGPWLAEQAWIVSPGETSWAARVELWSHGLWTIADFPLTGTGMNIFRRMAGSSFPLYHFEYGQDIGHSHHAYIQVALDLGLPGLVSYLALLFGIVASGLHTYRRSGTRYARHVALSGVTGIVIHAAWGFADAIALGAKQGFLWWSMLALVATVAIQDRQTGTGQATAQSLPEVRQEQSSP
jgi:putative inorganic carbon (HCO3(-)) transporter